MNLKESLKRWQLVALELLVGFAIVAVLIILGVFMLTMEPTELEIAFFFFYLSEGLFLGIIGVDLKKEWMEGKVRDERVVVLGILILSFFAGMYASHSAPQFLWFLSVLGLCLFISSTTDAIGLLDPNHYEKLLPKKIAAVSKLPFYSFWVSASASLPMTFLKTRNEYVLASSFILHIVLIAVMFRLSFPPTKSKPLEDSKSDLERLEKDYKRSKARTDVLISPERIAAIIEASDESEETIIRREAIGFEHVAGEILDGRRYVSGLEKYCGVLESEYESAEIWSALISK